MKAIPELESDLDSERSKNAALRTRVEDLERECSSVKKQDNDAVTHLTQELQRASALVNRQEQIIVEMRSNRADLEEELGRYGKQKNANDNEIENITRKYKAQVDENTKVTERLVGLEKRNVELRRENEDLQ